MSAQPLPPRPDLEQLKRQAKELLDTWKAAPVEGARPWRLRDAQREIARRHGFDSWDALRAHVEDAIGRSPSAQPRRRGLDYDDPIPDVVTISGPLTRDVAARLADERAEGLKLDGSVAADGFGHLAQVPSLRRLDLSGRDDLRDDDLRFLERLPWLTAVSLAGCGGISDAAVAHLRAHRALEQVNLKWTRTGDPAVAALAGHQVLHRLVVGAALSDAGAARLRELPALASPGTLDSFLSVSSARTLTDDALVHIGSLQGVSALDLSMSVFGSPHYTARGMAHLRGMTALEALNFHGALATDAVLEGVAAIPRLRALHCQDIASGDEGFIALGRSITLERLGARFCHRLTDRGFAALAALPRLQALGIGGSRLTDAAWAPLADAQALVDLNPNLSRDGAFVHIGRIPHLERLTNVYNRATTDAATRYLRNHPRLVHYGAFGTQITDESLRILADLPRLETLEFENCARMTDTGLRDLARAPRLRRVSVWSCARVTGEWLEHMSATVEAKSEPGPPGQVEGYRAETLLDYPDMPVPDQLQRGANAPPAPDPLHRGATAPPDAGMLATLVPLGLRAIFVADGLELSIDSGVDPRWVSAITEDPLIVPFRLELVVRPITMLRLVFGGHNRFFAFDERGTLVDTAPWFMKTDAQKGRAHPPAIDRVFSPGDWARITLEVDARQARLFVDGELRHSRDGEFTGVRSRVGVGLQQHGILVLRELSVESLGSN